MAVSCEAAGGVRLVMRRRADFLFCSEDGEGSPSGLSRGRKGIGPGCRRRYLLRPGDTEPFSHQ